MKTNEKYLEALKTFDDFVTVAQWAEKVGEIYPNLLEKAVKSSESPDNLMSGEKEIAKKLSSKLSRDGFDGLVKIDDSDAPRRVKYITHEELEENISKDVQIDLEPLKKREIEKFAEDKLVQRELYRLEEFRNIQKSLKIFFNLDFELDHAKALLNQEDAGDHHPDNFQLILKYHCSKKSNNNWMRFNIEEQITYIKKAIEFQLLVAGKLEVEMDMDIMDSLIERLKQVYS